MDGKSNKMCKERLRRLRPDIMDKLKTKRGVTKSAVQISSSSSELEDDLNADDRRGNIRSPLDLGSNKDFDVLLTETQAALKLSSENVANRDNLDSMDKIAAKYSIANTACSSNAKRILKHFNKQKSSYYPPLEGTTSSNSAKVISPIDNGIYDLTYYHSDDEGTCSYNCNHAKTSSTASVLALAPIDRRSSTGSSSSPLSDKCSMRLSKLFESNYMSVMDHENPPRASSKILSIKEFDPLSPQKILIKSIVSLSELSQREDNVICIDIDKQRILEFSEMSPEEKKNYPLNPFMDASNVIVTHSNDEFLTFCLCENCEKYREFIIHIMVQQFKAAHMVVMLLDVLIQSYGPMLKNVTAYNKFKMLLDSNKEIYWITCGVIYHKRAEHLDFIYDEYLSDNMIFVLFSSILMLNNPVLLLQILAFHVKCVVTAYAEGFLEIVEPDKSKIPAEEMINYILNGYDELMRISEHVASYLFTFENEFLRNFSLTWKLLSQRLYQQHVHIHLADTMLACIITLKEEELTSRHTDLIKRYIQFDEIMNCVEKRWTEAWIELNKFNLSESQRKRRKSLLDVYHIFDTVVEDAIGFSLQDSVDDNDFYDFRFLKNRRLAWKNIMSYTKMKWPDGFFKPPNTLVVDDKCKTCNISLEYHADCCKCITCSIAGGPLPPKRDADGKCSKCLAHEIVEKDVNFYDSKILNVCTNDDFQNLISKTSSNGVKRKITALQEVGQQLYPTLATVGEMLNIRDNNSTLDATETRNSYHISWAVFNHLNNRKRYPYATIEEQYFCRDCKLPSCRLALKILNSKISPSLSRDLVHYYQPMTMSREELRSILPNILLHNRKLFASNNGLDFTVVHDLVVEIYWVLIISIYAIYFIDYDDCGKSDDDGDGDNFNGSDDQKQETNKYKPSFIDVLELANNDIKVNLNKLTGNKDDTKFLEFVYKLKSLSPYNIDVESNFEIEDMQKKLNDILKITDNQESQPSESDSLPPPLVTPCEYEEQAQHSDLTFNAAVDSQPKKLSKEKPRKCCFDHSEFGGEHCRENLSSKKRLKKDCNHARMNETRDRLRKKLSQIVNEKKSIKPLQLTESSQTASTSTSISTAADYADARNIMEHFLNPEELELFQHYLPRPDFWNIQDFVASFDHIYSESRRNEEKKNLCECLQNFKTNSKTESKNKNNSKKVQRNHQHVSQQEQLELHSQQEEQQANDTNQSLLQQSSLLELTNTKSNRSNNSTRDASTSSQSTKINKEISSPNPTTQISTSKAANNLDFVSEICDIIDNYSKEQAKRKWIKETLSFIEGPTASPGKKKIQPQTLNPKKAAKKAKQKQRKEEEKRIAELQDLRAQFHNIFFKEFSEKLQLKSLKANKKRDKKKISEMENNIKNLQRAKAKVETAILELIATVKQTNSEFKFSYLLTKEQQMEKVRELEGRDSKEGDRTIKVRNLLHHNAKEANQMPPTPPNPPFTMTPTNNLNMVPESYSMPYAHANHFPYNLGFSTPAAPAPFGIMRASPLCYAPSSASSAVSAQQQQLGPDVTLNTRNNKTTDPSKRIVTIRRVNLPNVPEPQVTVTAKGPSPDKDKLLYTFINGQLIQTGTAPPITIPQLPAMNSVQQPQLHTTISASQKCPATKLTAEHLLSIPPPPPPKLSKTQVKKERKRLAKLEAERAATEKADRLRIESEQQKLSELKEQKQLKMVKELQPQQQKYQPKININSQPLEESKLSCCQSSSNNKKVSIRNKTNIFNYNSTTSVSTNETHETPKLPQMLTIKNSAKQKRSDSTTTSCSAATSTSSNNSTSSQMNTRDNSVSSIKPLNVIRASNNNNNSNNTDKNQKACPIQKSNAVNKNIKTKSNHVKQKPNKKLTRIPPPTPSTTSSDAENEGYPEPTKTEENKSSPPPSKTQKQPTNTSLNNQKKLPPKQPPAKRALPPSTSDTETEEGDAVEDASKLKEHKKRRPKLVDNGQFDNNPFKSLHMQDSETDCSSEDDDKHDGSENEVDIKQRKRHVVHGMTMKKDYVKLKHNDEKIFCKPTTQTLRKNVETEFKEDKTQLSSTSLISGTKNLTNKSPKNKNVKYQELNEKTVSKQNNEQRCQQKLPENETKSSNQTSVLKKGTQQNTISNGRKSKIDNRSCNTTTTKLNSKNANASSASVQNEPGTCSSSSRNNPTRNSNNNRSIDKLDQSQHHHHQQYNQMPSPTCGNLESENHKKTQRNKKLQKHHKNCCSSGIPNHMGYFNVNDTPQSGSINPPSHNHAYQTLAEQMQALRLSGHQLQTTTTTTTAMATAQQRQQHINSANVSIMDQLNRGVQVENLSLPPGITLTKVDPIKSEQLRQKSESIKKLAKPLQQQQHLSQNSQTFHHSSTGATIIGPPIVNPMASYYGSALINATTAGLEPQNGVIMVEANPPKASNVVQTNVISSCNRKQSKNKKRRNKSNANNNNNNSSCSMKSSGENESSNQPKNSTTSGHPKMITLRNPMFHNGPTAAAARILQQPSMLPGRPVDGFPMPVPLPVDQPAAIIKNENGMYTIRNPALHQAVTSGLAMGGYRQFGGNVNYYTPQEAAAEAARATLQQQQLEQYHNDDNKSSTTGSNPSSASSYSYFPNEAVQTNTPHNNISISCTSIGVDDLNSSNIHVHHSGTTAGGLIGDAAIIQRPSPQKQRPISAIGSEIKTAQQQKQKTKIEQQWSNFVSDTSLPINKSDNLVCNTSFLGAVSEHGANSVVSGSGGVIPVTDLSLQEKYQQSKYYNGFDVFTGNSGGSSGSGAACTHIHHSCGDDSPPPSVSGYNSYLEGIPNTGVIRYDDASFLKNLIPGQNLNNEVSIHNVNDSNFVRNDQSPQAHRVEITQVYSNRPSSKSLYESAGGQGNPTNFMGNYRDTINDYSNDATNIFPNNMHVNLNELETSLKYDFEQPPPTTVTSVADNNSHNTILDFKDLLIKNGTTSGSPSHRTSPYLVENALEGFVQNINSIQISNTLCEEQSSQMNASGHCVGHVTTATTSTNNTSNAWW